MRRRNMIAQWVLLATGAGLLLAGLADGGFRDVLNKAMLVCYECMGIG